jgi:DNA-binding NarL/FixJ family response regulator
MSLRGVQLVIGRLLTDAEFRRRFETERSICLIDVREQGLDLSDREIASLVDTDPRIWSTTAMRLNPGLHRGSYAPLPRAVSPLVAQFTERQRRVLSKVSEGFSNKEIALQEGVSEAAIKATVQQLFRKAHVRRRAQLVRFAIDSDLTGMTS